MTLDEFAILDELYFLCSHTKLKSNVDLGESNLISNLKNMVSKGWIKVYSGPSNDNEIHSPDWNHRTSLYYYVASKKGLLIHNHTSL